MHAKYAVPDPVVEGINEFDDLTRTPTKWTLNNIWDSHGLFPSREVYISTYCFWTSSWKLWRILLQNTWNTQTVRLNIVIQYSKLCQVRLLSLKHVFSERSVHRTWMHPKHLEAGTCLKYNTRSPTVMAGQPGYPPNVLPLRNNGFNSWLS